MKVIALTRGDLTSRWKQSMKPVATANCEKSAEVIVLRRKCAEGRSMDWRLFATKPKGGYIWKPAVLNDLLDVT
jgi:hypothetical protein